MRHSPIYAARLAERFLSRGDTAIDVGAAAGEYTRIYAQRVGPRGQVVAVEPHADLGRRFRARISQRCVTFWPGAMGDRDETRTFYADRGHLRCSSLYRANVPTVDRAYEVPVRTVDTLVDGLRRPPRLIQVDAQGGEAAILRGATRTLALPIVWVIELWAAGLQRAGASVRDVTDPFRQRGYTPETPRGDILTWDEVQAHAGACRDSGHIDVVMVPAPLAVAA